jgi:hypothetical protein
MIKLAYVALGLNARSTPGSLHISVRLSLQLIEESYSADVSQVTWRPNNPDPQGAA